MTTYILIRHADRLGFEFSVLLRRVRMRGSKTPVRANILASAIGAEAIGADEQRHVIVLSGLGLERDGALGVERLGVHGGKVLLHVEDEARHRTGAQQSDQHHESATR